LLSTAFEQSHPVAVRYPRGAGVGAAIPTHLDALPFGKGEVRRVSSLTQGQGRRIAIVSFGTLLYPSLMAAEEFDATVVNMRWAKPLDEALLLEVARSHDMIVTIEDGTKEGGAGSAVLECLARRGICKPTLVLGLPDVFVEHGDPVVLMSMQGLDTKGISRSLQKFTKHLSE
jgi:1-deoxy-D-xylulose-5-phosphate synthase